MSYYGKIIIMHICGIKAVTYVISHRRDISLSQDVYLQQTQITIYSGFSSLCHKITLSRAEIHQKINQTCGTCICITHRTFWFFWEGSSSQNITKFPCIIVLLLIYLYLITIFNERFIISLPAYKKGTQQLPCKLSNLLPFQKAQETEHP